MSHSTGELYVVHGRKIVYFPRITDMNVVRLLTTRLLTRLGSEQFKGHEDGWVQVEFRPG
jgi:hypothetical protein